MSPSPSPYALGFDAGITACREFIAVAAAKVFYAPSLSAEFRVRLAEMMTGIADELAALRVDAPEPSGVDRAKEDGRE